MAPDLTWEGTAVQRELADAIPQESGDFAARADPAHAEVQPDRGGDPILFADYMMTVYQTPQFDRRFAAGIGVHACHGRAGAQLFYSKFACQSCHIADFAKDKGYIGPALAGTGKRFNAAWVITG